MTPLTLIVVGEPTPQGSVRAFNNRVVQGGSKEGRRKLGDWRQAIGEEARRADLPTLLDQPLAVSMVFFLPKPASIPKWRQWAWKKPDLDKLVRAALDALTNTLFVDDSRVVDLHATKAYAVDCRPGCVIRVHGVVEDEAPWEAASLLRREAA